jgi:glycosyltransferase involved in cell wall biosynthesis
MRSKPLVSILIPTFNQHPDHLRACLDSAIAQDYSDVEVVISDNHSTGPASKVITEYAHPRVRVVKPPAFMTMTENFAFCARAGRGDYFSLLASDDLLVPSAISSLMAVVTAHPEVAFCCGNIIRSQRYPSPELLEACLIRPSQQPSRIYSPEEAGAFFFPWRLASTWMAGDLIRRTAYEATGGFEKCVLSIGSDIWLTGCLLKQGSFACLSEPLAFFRARPSDYVDVDPGRRLLEFSDTLLLSTAEDLSLVGRIRRWIHHVHLIDRVPQPTESMVRSCERACVVLRVGGRPDLARALAFYRRHPMVWQVLAWLVGPPIRLRTWWLVRRSGIE